MNKKVLYVIFAGLVYLSLLAPLWVFKDLLFPFVTSKAFYFRILIELALPVYLYLIISQPHLRPKWRRQYLNWLMVVFLLLNLLAAFTGVSVIRSLFGNFERMGGVFYLAHLTLLYFYVLCLGQMGGSYLKRFLQSLLAVALVVTVNGIFGKLGWPTLTLDPSLPARVSSTLGNPIYLGSFLVVPMFLSIYLGAQAEKKFWQWAYYFYALLFFIGILLSGTRGTAVGLVVGIFLAAVVYLIFTPNKKIKIYGSALAVLFVLLYGVLSLFNSKLPHGSDLQRLFTLKDSNTEARLVQWGVALKGYEHYPVFGVGPENYYFLANKYYNPKIFLYDRSWFDKPHNYWLEILVTDGIFGFLAYMGILAVICWALYKGYKSGFLTLFEFAVLLAGLVVYQVQNLTVFDTVSASLAFYSFMGFAGFIWDVSGEPLKKDKAQNRQISSKGGSALPVAVAGVSLVVVAYIIYAANIVPMEIAKAVNYGSAYATADPATSLSYFQRAMSLPFNFDLTETAQKYADSASSIVLGNGSTGQTLTTNFVNGALDSLNAAIAVEPNYPILWMDLAEVDLYKGVVNGQIVSVDPGAEVAARQAMALAPGREEPILSLVQVYNAEGNQAAAESLLEALIKEFPTDNTLPAQLASLYRLQGNMTQAVNLAEQALSQGYTFPSVDSMGWLVNYYEMNKDYQKALALLQAGVQLEPTNWDAQADLAKLYYLTGQPDQAIATARAVIQGDPTQQATMQQLIDQISQSPSSTPQ